MEIIITERDNGTRRVQLQLKPGSKVEQSHRDMCNINQIMKKVNRTGLFPARQDVPTYGDFTGATDFQDAIDRIQKAEDDFLALPSGVRKRFENDPGKLIDFLENPENEAEAVQMGLKPKPDVVSPAPEKAAPAAAGEPEKPSA